MRILIYEPDCGGHHLHHVRNILLAIQDVSTEIEITVALPTDATTRSEFATQLGDLHGRFTFDASLDQPPAGLNIVAAMSQRRDALLQAISRTKPDRLYVPYADGIGQILGSRRAMHLPSLPRDLPSEALIFRGGFAYPQPTLARRISSRMSWAAARRAPWTIAHVLDPIVYDRVVKNDANKPSKFRLMPEPVEQSDSNDRAGARAELKIPIDGRYIGCVGLIDGRKGVDILLRAFAAANFAPTDRLLLVGRHGTDIKPLLAGEFSPLVKAGRIISIDQTVPTPLMLRAIEASDLIAALYPRHIGSASIAIRAAAGRRPVLASNFGWLGTIVPRFDLGWTCDAQGPVENVAFELKKALQQAEYFELSDAAHQYIAFNTVENFQAHWAAGLRENLGLPPAEGYHSLERLFST